MASIERFNDHGWRSVVPEADLGLYAAYRRETKVGPRPALLAIDLYNLVFLGGPRPPAELAAEFPSSCGIYAHRAIEPIRRLIAAARGARIPVLYCTQDMRAQSRPRGISATKRRPGPSRPDDYEIHAAFAPEPSDIVIAKQRASAFQGTPIVSHLSFLGIESLIVCGEATSGCVRASVVDAFSIGLHITVVEEATFDQTELTHHVNLFDMAHKYADVMHLDEVEAHLKALS